MTLNQEAEIIYLYIVENLSMDKVADRTGWDMKTVSETVRGYGFNDDYAVRTEWAGKDKGRYKRGSAACRGVTVTRQLIKEYLEYADEWEWHFDWFIADVAQDMADQRQQQRQMQEAQRQAEQNARAERERMEREARERARRQEEYERQQKEQEKKNTNEYYRLLDIGKKALKENRLQEALDTFYAARALFDAVELYGLIARVLAISLNADAHCKSIIRELREYETCLQKQNKKLSVEELLWLSRALSADNQPLSAATRYSMAAQAEYDKKNYVAADQIYRESYAKTGIYTNWGPDKFFKLAYARSCTDNMTREDHLFCLDAYTESIQNSENSLAYSLGNMAWHYIKLGNYKEAASHSERSMVFGNEEAYVYRNLVDAYLQLGQYDKVHKTLEKMDARGISYAPWQKAECILLGNLFGDASKSRAEALYKQQLSSRGFHGHSCYRLISICKSDVEACKYAHQFITSEPEGTPRYKQAASILLERATRCGDEYYMHVALTYNPEEKERIEKQKAQEKKRREAERLERERQEKLRLEKERLERERLERLRLEKERAQKEQAEKERLEAERREREERERLERLQKQEEEDMLLILL